MKATGRRALMRRTGWLADGAGDRRGADHAVPAIRFPASAPRWLVTLMALTACSPARPAVEIAPDPEPAPVVAPPAPPAPTRVTIATRHDTLRYDVISTARVERDSAGQPNREEIVSRARVSFAMERIGNGPRGRALDLRSTGRVDGFVITSSERVSGSRSSALPGVAAAPSRPVAPLTVPFDATLNGLTARVSPRPALANECDKPEMSALSLARELLVRLPPELVVGASWTDTTRVFMCRGGVPVTVQQVGTATVRALESGPAGPFTRVHIDRTLQTRVEGQLATSWRSVGLTGQGSGTQRVLVDATTGALVEMQSESTMRLDVHDSARPDQGQQSLTQRVTVTARQVP